MNAPNKMDNWSDLLSELGIAPPESEAPSNEKQVPETETTASDEVAPNGPESASPQPEPSKAAEKPAGKPEGKSIKSSFFDIFPKIDLFGSGKKEKVDIAVSGAVEALRPAVEEAVQHARDTMQDVLDAIAPSRLGKAKDSPKKPAPEPPKDSSKDSPKEAADSSVADSGAPASRACDPWSALASQLGILSTNAPASAASEAKSSASGAVEEKYGEEAVREDDRSRGRKNRGRRTRDTWKQEERSEVHAERESAGSHDALRQPDPSDSASFNSSDDFQPIPKNAFGSTAKRGGSAGVDRSDVVSEAVSETPDERGKRGRRRDARPERSRDNRREERQEEYREDSRAERREERVPREERREERQEGQREPRRRERRSFFDEVEQDPVRESQRKLEKVLGLDESFTQEEAWDRTESDESRRDFRDTSRSGERPRGRRERFVAAREETLPDEISDEAFAPEPVRSEGNRRRRSRRNAELARLSVEEEGTAFESDVVEETGSSWNIEDESKPVERQRGRRGKRGATASGASARESENRDEDSFDSAELALLHRSIPSWAEAVATVVDVNLGRRNQNPRSGGRKR